MITAQEQWCEAASYFFRIFFSLILEMNTVPYLLIFLCYKSTRLLCPTCHLQLWSSSILLHLIFVQLDYYRVLQFTVFFIPNHPVFWNLLYETKFLTISYCGSLPHPASQVHPVRLHPKSPLNKCLVSWLKLFYTVFIALARAQKWK